MESTKEAKYKVVFARHGQSQWNKENRFTGWYDVGLTEQGREEARVAGELLKEKGFQFDVAHTSVLKRAILTLNGILDATDHHHIPVQKSWRLNERHYGALQGLNKAETAEKHGEDKVHIWRRSFDIPPPSLEDDDERHPKFDRKYSLVPKTALPSTESLKLTIDRVLPYWFDNICSDILEGKNVLVVAHGNSLRSMVKYLNNLSDEEIVGYNIPTGIPFVYEFDEDLKVVRNYYLIEEEELKARQEEVANQAKKKE
ncbi:unnamed protein product [Moneuplotes crassus]|uniref:phosphoglycerate mutase (2,3-diphosphoglycerate-dependent) n=2 Tax=Euplotes crassus TaxID=5936 RepID=A0AAD1XTN2_EUPCR|nr:unnamed protein product [Moneuplotes crassus]